MSGTRGETFTFLSSSSFQYFYESLKSYTVTTGKPLEQTSLIQINKYLHRHINIGASTSIRYTHSTDIGALGKYERRKKNPVVFFFFSFFALTRALKII